MRLYRALLLATTLGAAALVACTDTGGDQPKGNESPGTEALAPPPATLRRLLARQYRNAIRDLLGEAASQAADPPTDTALNGFDSIGASQFALGDAAVVRYEASARAVAAAAMGDQPRIDGLASCVPAGPEDAACHRQFIERFGRLAWRRPLVTEELDTYVGVAQLSATEFDDFYAGVEYAIAALLQSPNFLYMVEIGQPLEGTDVRALTGHEVASRLSFFLLDTTPDEGLLDAAEAGALGTDEGVRAAAAELVARPEARSALRGFYDEFLRLRDLGGLVKDGDMFPTFTPTLAAAMREETLRLLDDVVWDRDADYREIIDADYTFVNPELAAFYGVDAPASGDFERVTLPPEQQRAGLLGQPSFLSIYAHAAMTSPTLRGRFVRERLLCQSIPAPPNNVVTEFPDDTQAKTMREKLVAHQKEPSCAGCHTQMDNIGLALENFDGMGAFRTTENGVTLDVTGSIEGVGAFDGERELSKLLREEPEVMACIMRNLFRHATGHVETPGEEPALAGLAAAFEGSGYRVQDLLVELVSSDAFRVVGTPE